MEELYHAALELSGEERAALLARSDPEIRRAVEILLAQGGSGAAVLDRPAWEWAANLLDSPTSQIESGALLGPYRVESRIGAGGMGQVYRATDSRLNRFVAIKFLSAQFSDRFEREAKAIAALNHPNICQIYDIGPNYLVMEYIDGSPVVSPDQQPLAASEVLRIAVQIASALQAAHAQGIIHRDLKPANILLSTTRTVKLLDFGLAKQTAGTDTAQTADLSQTMGVTQPGTIMGSPAYMSPEQAQGRPTDARSDIFSFGAVLYEMLAGRRAFSGDSVASTLGAILYRDPAPLNAPPALNAIVLKCLAKSPDARYQTANDLQQALEKASLSSAPGVAQLIKRHARALAFAVALMIIGVAAVPIYRRVASTGRIDSIAVLPLDMKSSDPEADYISDGITESINNSLAKLPSLRVIPHSVALHYKGKTEDLQKVGDALGVQAVLTGRVVQHGDDLSIGIELDEVRNGKQLWGQQYFHKVADLLMLQNDIAKEVSQRLRSQLSTTDQQKLALGSTDNPHAYQLFLKGEYYSSKFTKEGFDKGIDYLNRAIAIDPNYAQAYSALANNYINQDDWFMAPKEAGPKARDAARRALALDETDVEAHVALAIESQWYEWDWAASEREFKRAIELKPDSGDAHGYYSWFLPPMRRNDEAVEEAERALRIDPISTGLNGNLGSVFVFTHQWDKAIEQLRAAIDLDHGYWFDYCFLGRAYEQKGRLPEAIATFQRGLTLEGNTELWSGLGHAYAASGNKAEAQKVLDHLKELSTHSYVAPYNIAVIYVGLGEKDEAFAWLNRAHEERSYTLAEYLTTDARLDTLHSDPRFAELVRRIGLEWTPGLRQPGKLHFAVRC
jgi:serine/threonine protein kinase